MGGIFPGGNFPAGIHQGGIWLVGIFRVAVFLIPMKSDKTPYMIYADIESLIKEIDSCKNNPEKSSTTKIGKHISCGCSIPAIWAFDHVKNRHSLYHGEDCMESFCESLREHAKSLVDSAKKKNVTVNKTELKLHQDITEC